VRVDVGGIGRAVNLPGPLDGRRIRQLVRIHCIVFPPFPLSLPLSFSLSLSSRLMAHTRSSGRDLASVCAQRA